MTPAPTVLEDFLRDAEVATRLHTQQAMDEFISSLAERATYNAHLFEFDNAATRARMRAMREMFLIESLRRGYCSENVLNGQRK